MLDKFVFFGLLSRYYQRSIGSQSCLQCFLVMIGCEVAEAYSMIVQQLFEARHASAFCFQPTFQVRFELCQSCDVYSVFVADTKAFEEPQDLLVV